MRFTWEPNKNRKNIRNHSIDFNDVPSMFDFPMLTTVDNRKDYGEERWIGIGFLKGIIAVVAYTEDDELEEIRIISARKATKYETIKFKEKIRY
jgi:uncharacterized DUF497 family protein